MHKVNRAQQVAANAVLRERIELVQDATTRYELHKQHGRFIIALNDALDNQRVMPQYNSNAR